VETQCDDYAKMGSHDISWFIHSDKVGQKATVPFWIAEVKVRLVSRRVQIKYHRQQALAFLCITDVFYTVKDHHMNLKVYALSVKSSGIAIPPPKATTCKPNRWRSQPAQTIAAVKHMKWKSFFQQISKSIHVNNQKAIVHTQLLQILIGFM